MAWRMSFIVASAGGAQSMDRRIIVVSAVAVGSLIRYCLERKGQAARPEVRPRSRTEFCGLP